MQSLLFALTDFVTVEMVEALREVGARLAGGEWTFAPPTFVDAIDASSCTRPEDLPIRTLGFVLSVSSMGEKPETPRDEVRRLINALRDFSRAHGVGFEVEFDGDGIGSIERGEVDESLQVGLLDSWDG